MWQRQALRAQEGELVPVPALEHEPVVADLEEPATAQAERLAPLQDGLLAVFEDLLDDTPHEPGNVGECRSTLFNRTAWNVVGVLSEEAASRARVRALVPHWGPPVPSSAH